MKSSDFEDMHWMAGNESLEGEIVDSWIVCSLMFTQTVASVQFFQENKPQRQSLVYILRIGFLDTIRKNFRNVAKY